MLTWFPEGTLILQPKPGPNFAEPHRNGVKNPPSAEVVIPKVRQTPLS